MTQMHRYRDVILVDAERVPTSTSDLLCPANPLPFLASSGTSTSFIKRIGINVLGKQTTLPCR
ncbi:hypothetical protein M378DRAFT_161365 [Amanita muscaria Koide BX008]|uniref:Uncharacterized protein n=1 Tax=Amanita muscaria (strain Koide BX008) TaxID=946122 RepID=A0A0C2X9X0_AMAMK|nr:hypothetical protein M378DRAFT_161365 [Amanita muscaria Koide BX008]